jgi:LysR family hydrogen peroxide-inducible transcriptional activator
MNLRALHYFVALADLKHFSKVEEACFVSLPTLSIQIKKLEDELGVQLASKKVLRLADLSGNGKSHAPAFRWPGCFPRHSDGEE